MTSTPAKIGTGHRPNYSGAFIGCDNGRFDIAARGRLRLGNVSFESIMPSAEFRVRGRSAVGATLAASCTRARYARLFVELAGEEQSTPEGPVETVDHSDHDQTPDGCACESYQDGVDGDQETQSYTYRVRASHVRFPFALPCIRP